MTDIHVKLLGIPRLSTSHGPPWTMDPLAGFRNAYWVNRQCPDQSSKIH